MHFRFPQLLLLLCAVFLPACSLFEPGGPAAAITVKGHSRAQVQDVVERVFVDDGYKPFRRILEGVVFEKDGSKTDRVLYGDWDSDSAVTVRVLVAISQVGDDQYRLRCIPSVARMAHDVSFEDEHRRMAISSPTLGRLLRETRKQCDELFLSRDSTTTDISN